MDTGGTVKVYDTAGHAINGFGQQQSQETAMIFQTDGGTVDLNALRVVG